MQLHRRSFLRTTGLVGVSWLTGVAEILAKDAERAPNKGHARSLIFLWLAGGPSQLETFDPHPTRVGGGTKIIQTAAPGVQLAAGYERLAEEMQDVSIIRSLVSREGDHERGTYTVKTGYRPDPTVTHPSIGAICCHQLPVGGAEIPRHISILPSQWPAKGGLLGHSYDAFQTYDPIGPVPDVRAHVPDARQAKRLADRQVIEEAFSAGRRQLTQRADYEQLTRRATTMMASEQLAAFDVRNESRALRDAYGDTPFGRGCLAARRLIEVGARCVEVTLSGWDTHVNNHQTHAELARTLDPAFSALVRDLRARGLLEHTVVVCGGEFGRTPKINRLEGRDHWPHGFSMAIAGGGIRGGQVIGATDPEGSEQVDDPQPVANLHATILKALGIDPAHEELAPIGRPIKFSEGAPIEGLFR